MQGKDGDADTAEKGTSVIHDLSFLNTSRLLFSYLDILPRHGTYCAFNMEKNVNRHEIITNRGKKKRVVYAPSMLLRYIQGQARKIIFSHLKTDDCVHGFVKERGCRSNAVTHVPSDPGRAPGLVLNIDLKDFFPSITPQRIYGLYKSVLGLSNETAAVLTKVTTYDGHLCQGFLTSPDLANFLSWKLDRRMTGLASKCGMVYTRYADDLTFSAAEWGGGVDGFVAAVRGIVSDEGFQVNDKKIAVMRRGRRQKVTGLVVSEHGVNVPRKIRRLLRSAVHHWPQQAPERRASIRGWISYVKSVDPAFASCLESEIIKSESESDTRIWAKNVSFRPFSEDIISAR